MSNVRPARCIYMAHS